MEKIKHILSPGKPVDDQTLYGSREGSHPAQAVTAPRGQHESLPQSSHQDALVAESVPTVGSSQHPQQQVPSDILSSNIRPDHPTPTSAGSTASIKSNVIGKVPTGTSLAQESTALPSVPATDGKFINDESLMVDVPTPLPATTSSSSFPLNDAPTSNPYQTMMAGRLDPRVQAGNAAPSTTLPSSGETGLSPTQQSTFDGTGVSSSAPTPAANMSAVPPVQQSASSSTTQQHHRDEAALGGAGVAGIAAYEATKQHRSVEPPAAGSDRQVEPHAFSSGVAQQSRAEQPLASSTYERSTTSSYPTQSTQLPAMQSGPSQTTQHTAYAEDRNAIHIPGAYPETPAGETEKNLGSGAVPGAADESAAVIAAREAFRKHDNKPPTLAQRTVNESEVNPYSSAVDPRVDSGAKRAAVPAAAAGATAAVGSVAALEYQSHHEQPTSTTIPQSRNLHQSASQGAETAPRGTLGEKIAGVQSAEPTQPGSFAQKIHEAEAAPGAGLAVGAAAGVLSESRDHKADKLNPETNIVSGPGDNEKMVDTDRHHSRDLESSASRTEPAHHHERAQHQGDQNTGKGAVLIGAGAAGTYEVIDHIDPNKGPKHQEDQAIVKEANIEGPLDDHTGPGTSSLEQRQPSNTAAAVSQPTEREFPLRSEHEHASAASAQQPTNFSHPTGARNVQSEAREASNIEHRSFPIQAAETGASGTGGLAAYESLGQQEPNVAGTHFDRGNDPLASMAHPRALEGYDDQRAVPHHESHLQGQEPEVAHRGEAAALGAGGAATGLAASGHHHDVKLEREREKTAERKHEEHEKHVRKSEEKHRKSEEKEHKHGFLHKILHPRKSKDTLDKEPRSSSDKNRASLEQQDELSSPATYDTGLSEHDKHDHGRNRLHKDPPAGYQG